MTKPKLQPTSIYLGIEWKLCEGLAHLTVLENKTTLLRRTVDENVVATAKRYAKPEVTDAQIDGIVNELRGR